MERSSTAAIHAEDTGLDAAAVTEPAARGEGEGPAQADQVEQFRRFLDTASPEDFEAD